MIYICRTAYLLIVSLFCFFVLLGVTSNAFAEYLTIDEVMYEQGEDTDPDLQDLEPSVQVSFDAGSQLLTVILSNDASYSGDPNAGHLLTGVGFNLPEGVYIEDTTGRDSSVALYGGSVIIDPKKDPYGTAGAQISQDDWGYANNVSGGHFVDTAWLPTTTVLTCMNSDADITFAGNPASNALMDSGDYGLQGPSPTPGHSTWWSIRNAVTFDLYLDGPTSTDWENLIAYIEANSVVVSYGSPGHSSHDVPEPGTLSACCVLFLGLLMAAFQRRKSTH